MFLLFAVSGPLSFILFPLFFPTASLHFSGSSFHIPPSLLVQQGSSLCMQVKDKALQYFPRIVYDVSYIYVLISSAPELLASASNSDVLLN